MFKIRIEFFSLKVKLENFVSNKKIYILLASLISKNFKQ